MTDTSTAVGLLLFAGVTFSAGYFWHYRLPHAQPKPKPDREPFEPLADFLAGVEIPPAPPQFPLPPERALPHVQKRKGKK